MAFLQSDDPYTTATGWLTPNPAGLTSDDHPALHRWAARVPAGHRAPMPPETLARIARMEAILAPARRGAVR